MLRLFGFLVLALAGAGGIILLDFNRTVQQASDREQPPPSFRSYLETVPDKLASLGNASRASISDVALSDMLPRAPEGWTMRPVTEKDIDGFLPKNRKDGDPAAIDLVEDAGKDRAEKGAKVAITAFERGERTVVVQLTRLPDKIFTDPSFIDRRYELQMRDAQQRGRGFATVRGLDITEEFLGDGMRARYFSASVGAQIQIRVLASKRLKDTDLVSFFETLDIRSMNASVIDRTPGLGEIPVIVIGSELTEADLAAFEADWAARDAAASARARDMRSAALAAAEEAQTSSDKKPSASGNAKPGANTECHKDSSGTKRCLVQQDG